MEVSKLIETAATRAKERGKLPSPDMRRAIRESAGVTQAEVGLVIGATGQAVSQYESGKREPHGATRQLYAELLHGLATHVG